MFKDNNETSRRDWLASLLRLYLPAVSAEGEQPTVKSREEAGPCTYNAGAVLAQMGGSKYKLGKLLTGKPTMRVSLSLPLPTHRICPLYYIYVPTDRNLCVREGCIKFW